MINAPPVKAVFRSLVYAKGESAEPDRQEVYYSWWYGGRWTPELGIQKHFKRIPSMYKIHLARRVTADEKREVGNPCAALLQVLLPEFEHCSRRRPGQTLTNPPLESHPSPFGESEAAMKDTPDRSDEPLLPRAGRSCPPWHRPCPRTTPTNSPIRPATSSSSKRVSFRLVNRALRRFWWQTLLVWLIGSIGLVALAYTKIKPTYDATSQVRVELESNKVFTANTSGPIDLTLYMLTQVAKITSPTILESALVENPKLRSYPLLQGSEDAEADLRAALRRPLPRTNLIQVEMSSPIPAEAAEMVNAVVKAYLDHSQMFNDEFTKKQIDRFRAQLDSQRRGRKAAQGHRRASSEHRPGRRPRGHEVEFGVDRSLSTLDRAIDRSRNSGDRRREQAQPTESAEDAARPPARRQGDGGRSRPDVLRAPARASARSRPEEIQDQAGGHRTNRRQPGRPVGAAPPAIR